MRRLRIYPYKIGLVFREGNFLKVLTEGSHWLWFGEKFIVYDMTQPFTPTVDLSILLQNKYLAKVLEIIEVKDNEIAFLYEDGIFRKVLKAGRHAFWKSIVRYQSRIFNLDSFKIPEDLDRKILMRPEVLPYIRVHTVESYEKGLLFVDGKFVEQMESGIYYSWKNQNAIIILKMDTRIQQMEISGQEILTKDKAALRINFHAQYKVIDIVKALLQTKDFAKQLYLIMQLAIREYVGTLTLDELLARKESVRPFIIEAASEKVIDIGAEIITCGIRDIILPGEIKTIMNQVLVAEKRAQANIITRREETASTRSLLNTARLMESNEMLFKLKEMEYVEKIAEKIGEITVSGGSKVVDQLKDIFTKT